jgi:hypothetical protein
MAQGTIRVGVANEVHENKGTPEYEAVNFFYAAFKGYL